jgi:hypothetical protein
MTLVYISLKNGSQAQIEARQPFAKRHVVHYNKSFSCWLYPPFFLTHLLLTFYTKMSRKSR